MNVSWTIKKAQLWKIDAFELWCWRRLLRVPWTGRSNQSFLKEISPEYSLVGQCWSWNSNTLATRYEKLTPWKRPWCWDRLKAGGEGDHRGWDGWMASLTQWTRVWAIWELVTDGEAWHAAVHGVAKSRTWLSDWTELRYKVTTQNSHPKILCSLAQGGIQIWLSAFQLPRQSGKLSYKMPSVYTKDKTETPNKTTEWQHLLTWGLRKSDCSWLEVRTWGLRKSLLRVLRKVTLSCSGW